MTLAHRPVRNWWSPLGAALLAGQVAMAGPAERVVPVETGSVTATALARQLQLSGTVQARRYSVLSPRVGGLVAEILVDAGDRVEAGQVLLRLDPALAEIEFARAQAGVAEAQARLREADRRRAEAAALVERKHIAPTNLDALAAEVAIQQAALARLEAERRHQAEIRDRHTLRAPFEGVVAHKRTEVGQWVDTGAAVIELAETRRLRVEVPVPQRYFHSISAGAPVELRFDARPEQVIDGKITTAIAVGSEAARTFPVRIEFDNADGSYAPGMSARVAFRFSAAEPVLTVPRDAVVMQPNGEARVWVIREVDRVPTVQPVAVETGLAAGDRVEIRAAGLASGDRVVVRGNENLAPQQTVRVIATRP